MKDVERELKKLLTEFNGFCKDMLHKKYITNSEYLNLIKLKEDTIEYINSKE